MALNLLTLTATDGAKVEVNPALIETIRTDGDRTLVAMASGDKITVVDPQGKIRERANYRSPDGFG